MTEPLNERLAHYYLNLAKPGVEYDLIKDLDFELTEAKKAEEAGG